MIKTLSLVVLISLGWLAPLPGTARPTGTADASLTPILDRMAETARSLRTLQASLSQQKLYTQLGIKDPPERGILYAKRKPNGTFSLRVEFNAPDRRILTVKDNYFVFFQPRINQVIEGNIDRYTSRAAAGFVVYLLGGVSQAMDDYAISLAGEETVEGRRTTHLVLTPKAAKKGLYRQIDLWIDHTLWLPTIQKFVEANRDEITLTLGEIKLNAKIPEDLFTQRLPANVQRVKG